MKVKGLDGKLHNWKLTDKTPLDDATRPRSALHVRARSILREMYPLERVLEELQIPASGGLALDFFVPTSRMCVEVHGQQHYKFVPHFHGDMLGFIESKKRDSRKRAWAEENLFIMVELKYDGSDDEWRTKLRDASRPTSESGDGDS